MQAFHSDQFSLPLPAGHSFPMSKYGMLREAVERELPLIRIREAPPATDGELALVHAPHYVHAVAEGLLSAAQQREIGFPWSPRMAKRARRSVGATIAAARAALAEGLGANLAGGTHHAFADRGSGYCVFNDVAVAARLLLAEGAVRRVLVVDLDVHQGDGTAAMLADEPRAFTLSVHCRANFPARKQQSDLDVALDAEVGDDDYLALVDQLLPALLDRVRPDLVFYNAGVDPHRDDRLGRLSLTDAGLAARERLVLDAVRARGLPLACVVGGGYADDLDVLARRHALLHEAIGGLPDW